MKVVKSPALAQYALTRLHNASFFMMVHAAPIAFAVAGTRSAGASSPDTEREAIEFTQRIWSKFTNDMSRDEFHNMCDQLWMCRNVEAFQHYVSSMLREAFVQRPETLRSSEAVKLSDLLAFSTMSEVIRAFAERKVESLSYQGFDDLMNYLRSTMGLRVEADGAVLASVKEAIEVRNIVVHNAGRVNRIFIKRARRDDLKDGSRFPLDQDYVIASGKTMHSFLEALDAAFIDHFHLQFEPSSNSEAAEPTAAPDGAAGLASVDRAHQE